MQKLCIGALAALTLGALSSLYGGTDLVVNEVSFKHGAWFELYNPTGSPVGLSGWRVENARGADNLSGSVPAGGFIVVAADEGLFRAQFPSVSNVVFLDGDIGKSFSSGADMLALVRPGDVDADLLNWGQADPSWANYRTELWSYGVVLGSGGNLSRIPNGLDRDLPNDFRDATDTPEAQNSFPTSLNTASWGKIKALFSGSRYRN